VECLSTGEVSAGITSGPMFRSWCAILASAPYFGCRPMGSSIDPYCRIGDLVSARITKRRAECVYLNALVDFALLEEAEGGREGQTGPHS
jgi:hypothetical protein